MELEQSVSRRDVRCAKTLFEVCPIEVLLRLFTEAGRPDCKVVVYLARTCQAFLEVAVDMMCQLCREFLWEENATKVDSLVASWIWHHPEGE